MHLYSNYDDESRQELADTLRAMQTRVAELVARLAGESALTAELLHANDTLNNLLLRHSRFLSNRSVDNAIIVQNMKRITHPKSTLES